MALPWMYYAEKYENYSLDELKNEFEKIQEKMLDSKVSTEELIDNYMGPGNETNMNYAFAIKNLIEQKEKTNIEIKHYNVTFNDVYELLKENKQIPFLSRENEELVKNFFETINIDDFSKIKFILNLYYDKENNSLNSFLNELTNDINSYNRIYEKYTDIGNNFYWCNHREG